jgi:hypothetical protein
VNSINKEKVEVVLTSREIYAIAIDLGKQQKVFCSFHE